MTTSMSVTPAFRRRLLRAVAAVALLMLLRAGLQAALGYYLSLPIECDQPCKVSDRNCSPLQLSLELKDAHARVGKMPRIWYRASVKNVGCGTAMVNADFFGQSEDFEVHQASKEDFHFRIADESGNEIPTPHGSIHDDGSIGVYLTTMPASAYAAIVVDAVHGAPREHEVIGKSLAGVEPYDVDEAADAEMFGKMNGRKEIPLSPGEELFVQPTKYAPYRETTVSAETGRFVGTGMAKIPVKLDRRIAPEPPPGFRLLQQLVFLRPGRYRVQLSADEGYRFESVYRYQTLPMSLYRWVWRLSGLLGVDLPARRSKDQPPLSTAVELEVAVAP
jgi:hypothetical protein